MEDGKNSKVSLQFRSEGTENKGGGNASHLSAKRKHDRFMFTLHGLDKVDFSGKNRAQCIQGMRIGVMQDDGGLTDHTMCSTFLYN